MAGIQRKYVNSRADFFDVLRDTIRRTKDLLKKSPGNTTIDEIDAQLDAIRRWTDRGREPTKDERRSVAIGPRIVREFEPAPNDEIFDWTERLYEVEGYFKDWFTDDQLATFDDSDPRSDFDD
jgi:hypothetical protein